MADTVTPEVRSRMMAQIKGQATHPELRVRRYLHSAGLRYRVNDPTLPGRPDLVFRSGGVVLFVHGCFWHRHLGCRFASMPSTRAEFWRAKFAANIARDVKVESELSVSGWVVMKIWECETKCNVHLDELYWRIRASSRGG
jgi:DNA mismatch endonuclease (patch repair protein)